MATSGSPIMADIPVDILFTIFSKLPIKSLMRFKCISKQWCNIISRDPYFAAMQMNNHNIEDTRILLLFGRGYFCSVKHGEDDSGLVFNVNQNFLEKGDGSNIGNYELQGSCNGLLLFTEDFDYGRVIFYNPLTQEVAAVPCQKSGYLSDALHAKYGFGFDSISGQYKIVRIFSQKKDKYSWINVAVEVFSLGGNDNSWRKIENFPIRPFQSRMVFVDGAIHWTSTDERHGNPILVSLLLNKEEFISSPLSNLFFNGLVDMGGFLGAVVYQWERSEIEIWIKKDVRGEWIKEYKIGITLPEGPPKNSPVEVIGVLNNGEVLMTYHPRGFISYNRENNTLKCFEVSSMEYDDGVIIHRGSLVSISRFCFNGCTFNSSSFLIIFKY